MIEGHSSRSFILGLDLGVASIGWALIEVDGDLEPQRIVRAGAHLFEAGVAGSIEQGRDESKAAPRRMARAMRRGYWRRQRRRRQILKALQQHNLLPPGDVSTPIAVDTYMKALDRDLRSEWCNSDHRLHLTFPLQLRAAGVTRELKAHEVGRAIYHLAQRRGFLSNRRTEGNDEDAKSAEEDGQVKKAIGELQHLIEASKSPTLGSFLATLDPESSRIRGRWTARQMLIDEFDALWAAQAPFHKTMTNAARTEIAHTIFYQRPLRKQSHLIGRCSLDPSKRRAPACHRLYQRFRMLQQVNDLEVLEPGKVARRLTAQERTIVLALLEAGGDAKFTTLKNKKSGLGLPKGSTFNFETEGESSIIGHRTDAKLRDIFGERFEALSESDRDQVVEDLRCIREPEALRRRGVERWGLSDESAIQLSKMRLEEGYGSLSLAAVRRLLPHMEQGAQFADAKRTENFAEPSGKTEILSELPPIHDPTVRERLGELRNPAVERSLTELRKLVNAIVRVYGKPVRIRIELGRDLKRGRKEREREAKRMAERRRQREAAAARLLKETTIESPRRSDIEKVLLADECNWHCPFSGKKFGWRDLFGPEPQFDIEHIWPYSRSLDDSFRNKTICHVGENRMRKRNHTPFEAYSATLDVYKAILQRVGAFKGDPRARSEKLARFEAEAIPEQHLDRHLNDTRYMSRRACEYLSLLYGGVSDASHTQRIQSTTGGLTFDLRRGWSLNSVLGVGDQKNRADHRHHAVDAIVVALTTPKAVHQASRAAQVAEQRGANRLFADFEDPWPSFREDVKKVVRSIVVSHRQSRKLSGALHAETNYSRPIGDNGAHHVRKELHKLSLGEIEQIVDPRCRSLVKEKFESLQQPAPAKAFAAPENLPTYLDRNGNTRVIRKVRIRTTTRAKRIGGDANRRYVAPTHGSNHHTVIVAHLNDAGEEVKWTDHPVTLLEAIQRKAAGQPVVQRDWGQGKQFKFSLAANEFIEIDFNDGARKLCRVLSISSGDIEAREHNDGRKSDEVKKSGDRKHLRMSGEKLRKLNARKVSISYLGETRRAGG